METRIKDLTREVTAPAADDYLVVDGETDGTGRLLARSLIHNLTARVFTALDNQPQATGFATLDMRGDVPVLDFDDVVAESAVFLGVVPAALALSTGLVVRIHFTTTAAGAGAVRWGAQIMRATSIAADAFGTAATATATAAATSGEVVVATITIPSANLGGLQAGEAYRLRVYRDAADGADTQAGDAELFAVELKGAA